MNSLRSCKAGIFGPVNQILKTVYTMLLFVKEKKKMQARKKNWEIYNKFLIISLFIYSSKGGQNSPFHFCKRLLIDTARPRVSSSLQINSKITNLNHKTNNQKWIVSEGGKMSQMGVGSISQGGTTPFTPFSPPSNAALDRRLLV